MWHFEGDFRFKVAGTNVSVSKYGFELGTNCTTKDGFNLKCAFDVNLQICMSFRTLVYQVLGTVLNYIMVCELIQSCRSNFFNYGQISGQFIGVNLEKEYIFRKTCLVRDSRVTFLLSLLSIYFLAFAKPYIERLIQIRHPETRSRFLFYQSMAFSNGCLVFYNMRLTSIVFQCCFGVIGTCTSCTYLSSKSRKCKITYLR